ncbi:MAG: efflux RND transporter periplasmic adaptor subunit [bacterium]|nr:efflux RND transporter periplasmic adaptor subunit [bacterium]
MRKKIIIIVSVIIALILMRFIISAFTHFNNEKKTRQMSAPAVTAEIVDTQNVTRHYDVNARVVAKYRVEVLARINGYLTKSYFKEGDYVKAGQVLFEIEPQEYQYAANKAKANLDNVQSQSDYYKKQLSRYKELVAQDYIAKSEYDNILAQSNAYNAQVESATSAYRDAQRNLAYTKVKAPVDGRVGIIDVTVGNYVSINSGDLTTINSSDPMYITFAMNSRDYSELVRIDGDKGANRVVEYTSSTGKKYELKGVQDFYDNKIDESTGTITLRATFPNPNDELIQGDFGIVTIYSNLKDNIPVIPQTATMENQQGVYVYTIDENNIPKLVYIKTMGQTGDNKWLVSEGLNAGDRIITSGLHKVIPGQAVKIVNTPVDNNTHKAKKAGILTKLLKKVVGLIKK